jgi:hypothetical protein
LRSELHCEQFRMRSDAGSSGSCRTQHKISKTQQAAEQIRAEQSRSCHIR